MERLALAEPVAADAEHEIGSYPKNTERLALAEPVAANASRETVNIGNIVQHLVDRSIRTVFNVRLIFLTYARRNSIATAKGYTHRNLIPWNRAQQLALDVVTIVQRMPNTWSNAVIARQIIASATSIGANIAEGHGRYTPGAHRNHLAIAKGSTAETDSWLDLLRRSGYLSEEDEARLHSECQEIAAMLTSKIRKLEHAIPSRTSTTHEEQVSYTMDDDASSPPFPFAPEDYQSSDE